MTDVLLAVAVVTVAAVACAALLFGVDAKRRLDRLDGERAARRALRRPPPAAPPEPPPHAVPRAAGRDGNVRLLGDVRRGPGEAG